MRVSKNSKIEIVKKKIRKISQKFQEIFREVSKNSAEKLIKKLSKNVEVSENSDGSKKFREKLLRKIPAKVSKNFKRQNILKRSKFQEILRKFRSNLFWKVKTQLKNVKVLGNSWWFKKFCKNLKKWSKNFKIKILAKAEDSENFWRRIKVSRNSKEASFEKLKNTSEKCPSFGKFRWFKKFREKAWKNSNKSFEKPKFWKK